MEQLPGEIVLYQSVAVIKGYERNIARYACVFLKLADIIWNATSSI